MGDVCRALTPGDDERDISRAVIDGAVSPTSAGARSSASSDRMNVCVATGIPFPRPPAGRRVSVMLAVAQRSATGSVVSLSSIVAAAPPADLEPRTRGGGVELFGRLLDATRPGATAADLYTVAADAYRAAGFPGEELKHHQGGAIGYRAREWVAHPRSQEAVAERQAFAWNPTITGTKVEDTALFVIDDRIDIITATPDWPSIPLGTPGRAVHASDIWRLT